MISVGAFQARASNEYLTMVKEIIMHIGAFMSLAVASHELQKYIEAHKTMENANGAMVGLSSEILSAYVFFALLVACAIKLVAINMDNYRNAQPPTDDGCGTHW